MPATEREGGPDVWNVCDRRCLDGRRRLVPEEGGHPGRGERLRSCCHRRGGDAVRAIRGAGGRQCPREALVSLSGRKAGDPAGPRTSRCPAGTGPRSCSTGRAGRVHLPTGPQSH